jgi:photosystem II stability/assembly factor-like uncharacterized protein
MRLLPLLFVAVVLQGSTLTWTPLATGVTARLRGVSVVDDRVVWASGSNGTIVRTTDGGQTWQKCVIPETETLDFRDIDAFDAKTAYALSIGAGESSRIYKTADGGATWTKQFVNSDPKAFFDAMAFWDANRGIAVSDSVGGQFVIVTTNNGGTSWERVPPSVLPPALDNEGFFAASGTNVAVVAPNHVFVGTGAASESRVLRSSDGGRSWQISKTPLASGPSAGIFSVAFHDATHGIVVGGDYKVENAAVDNAALTSDGGKTWTAVKGLSGFRSVVAYASRDGASVVAVGPQGTDFSSDGGKTWRPVTGPGFHTFGLTRDLTAGFGAGEKGSVGRLSGWSSTGKY